MGEGSTTEKRGVPQNYTPSCGTRTTVTLRSRSGRSKRAWRLGVGDGERDREGVALDVGDRDREGVALESCEGEARAWPAMCIDQDAFPREYVVAYRVNIVLFVLSLLSLVGFSVTALSGIGSLLTIVSSSMILCCSQAKRAAGGVCQLWTCITLNIVAAVLHVAAMIVVAMIAATINRECEMVDTIHSDPPTCQVTRLFTALLWISETLHILSVLVELPLAYLLFRAKDAMLALARVQALELSLSEPQSQPTTAPPIYTSHGVPPA
jgi:hypothetical protein